MAALRNVVNVLPKNFLKTELFSKHSVFGLQECVHFISYTSVPYSKCGAYLIYILLTNIFVGLKHDPRPLFFNREIQNLLRSLTRVDINKVFKRRKLGEKLQDPVYKFMTDEELQHSIKEAHETANELLQIPPAVPAQEPFTKILSKDPALQGLESSKFVFADITFGMKDSKRLITVRDVDGTLKEADSETRRRITEIYFPKQGRNIKPPRVFSDPFFENVLNRQEYVFLLDLACLQFEPYDSEYQKIVSIVYQHINDNNGFEQLRSTRHFGSLCFFLTWNKNIDNLLIELIETSYIDEATHLLNVYAKIHNVTFTKDDNLKNIEEYIEKFSNKKGVLQLALQAYKDVSRRKEEQESGVSVAN